VWNLRKPAAARITAFIERQRELPFSYAEVGATAGAPPRGYDCDDHRVCLGTGAGVFHAARAALRQWRQFPLGWTAIAPAQTPLVAGQTVAMLVRALGVWWLNACRVVYVFDEDWPTRRFGFAYGTLAAHVERGEERFSVEWDDDDRVWYEIRAFSRPRYWLARVGYPLARRMQRRFVRESQASMIRWCAARLAEEEP
jgi:uncharacterized protein (UPF0548 family)